MRWGMDVRRLFVAQSLICGIFPRRLVDNEFRKCTKEIAAIRGIVDQTPDNHRGKDDDDDDDEDDDDEEE